MPAAVAALGLLLAAAAEPWAPVAGKMLTPWGERVTPATAWSEYPRPTFVRERWQSLNGLWDYAILPRTAPAPAAAAFAAKILVPFAVEATLSGVGRRVTAQDRIWYRRSFTVPAAWHGERVLLHFEAVDFESSVWLNGALVGHHAGGSTAFSFDLTDYLRAGENELLVSVWDPTSEGEQPRGKQILEPRGIWYTPVSGIWQTVWLEEVPEQHVVSAKITPAISGKVDIQLATSGAPTEATVVATLDGKEVAKTSGPSNKLGLSIPEPKLWSPETPVLYDLEIRVGDDVVKSYVGLRETTIAKGDDGHLRFLLNGKPVFHWGTLDQGWWPDGLLTPPSDAAMRSDIEFLKAAGFNTIRKHIKVEPRRYYTHRDRIGMLVWQDQVSSGTGKNREKEQSVSPAWTRLAPNRTDANWPDAAHEQYMKELKAQSSLYRPVGAFQRSLGPASHDGSRQVGHGVRSHAPN